MPLIVAVRHGNVMYPAVKNSDLVDIVLELVGTGRMNEIEGIGLV